MQADPHNNTTLHSNYCCCNVTLLGGPIPYMGPVIRGAQEEGWRVSVCVWDREVRGFLTPPGH